MNDTIDGSIGNPERVGLQQRLVALKIEHRDLDEAIHVVQTSGRGDQLTLRRLKKQKLHLKDQIARLESQLIPDLNA